MSSQCCVKEPHVVSKNTFGVPKNEEEKKEWELALGMILKKSNRICSNHFNESDVIRSWTSGEGYSKYTICLKRYRLKEGAIPLMENRRSYLNSDETLESKFDMDGNSISSKQFKDEVLEVSTSILTVPECSEPKKRKFDSPLSIELCDNLYSNVLKSIQSINLPMKWHADIECVPKTGIIVAVFYKLSSLQSSLTRFIEKQLVITKDSEKIVHLNGKMVPLSELETKSVQNIKDLENLILLLDNIKCCQGSVSSVERKDIKSSFGPRCVDSNGMWKHTKCLIYVKSDESANSVCLWCRRLKYSIAKKCSRVASQKNTRTYLTTSKKKINKKNAKDLVAKRNTRAHTTIAKLKNKLNQIKIQMNNIKDSNLDKILNNFKIPQGQCVLIKEIFSAARVKNPKNRRYSENWMMLCLLLQIRSPGEYTYLREQNILPLPCINTVRSHLLKKGKLSFDEIFLRESLSVNTRLLTDIGLEDYNEGLDINQGTEKANHASNLSR